ncbi:hypothetical protein Tco_1578003 [Tanacetum coccineum]
MHNNIMAAGSRDCPPMLATRRYAQFVSMPLYSRHSKSVPIVDDGGGCHGDDVDDGVMMMMMMTVVVVVRGVDDGCGSGGDVVLGGDNEGSAMV